MTRHGHAHFARGGPTRHAGRRQIRPRPRPPSRPPPAARRAAAGRNRIDRAVQQRGQLGSPPGRGATANPSHRSDQRQRPRPSPPWSRPSATNGPRMNGIGEPTSCMISISSWRACRPSRTTAATVTAAATAISSASASPAPRTASRPDASARQPLAVVPHVGDARQRRDAAAPAPRPRPSRSASGRTRTSTDAGNGLSSKPAGQRRQLRELAAEARERLGLRHVLAAVGRCRSRRSPPRSRRAAPTSRRRAGRPRTRPPRSTRASSCSTFHVSSSSDAEHRSSPARSRRRRRRSTPRLRHRLAHACRSA